MSSEYGWTDQQILDLSLPRIHQARELVLARRSREQSDWTRLAEAVTKHIVANTVESSTATKKGAGQKAADNVRFLADQRAKKGREVSAQQASSMFGRSVASLPTVREVIKGG